MTAHRANVVLVAFSCQPDAGSEDGVGWVWARAAAELADVTVLTRVAARDEVEAAAAAEDLPMRVEVVDLPGWLRGRFPRKLVFLYYLLWQLLAGRALRRMERTEPVDVVHHVTWASDSLPSALLFSRAPIRIWGPVGGSTRTDPGLYRYLSVRGKVDQAVRDAVNGVIRGTAGERVARHATLVVALNDDVRRRWDHRKVPVVVEPNFALDLSLDVDGAPAPRTGERRTALFVGRLIPWKGLLLALRGLAEAPTWDLEVLGEGPELARAEALAQELGIAGQVHFRGRVPRDEVLHAMRHADALLFPSFHDSAPWAVGEAASLGCPVVCLDAGGPSLLAGDNAQVVPIHPADTLPARLGGCLEQLPVRGLVDDRWGPERLPLLLADWYGLSVPVLVSS